MGLKKPRKEDKVRLVFFSNNDSDLRQFEFNWGGVFAFLGTLSIVMGSLFAFSVTICNNLYQDSTSNSLARSNDFLRDKIKVLQNHMDNLSQKMAALEEETEDLEVLVGLSSTDYDSTMDASLVSDKEILMASTPVDFEYQPDQLSSYVSDLEERIERTMRVQSVIEDKFLQTQSEILHIPSIRPVVKGRITDRFGQRIDPFIERVKHHNGIDLSARYGTRVYAAAAGVVEFTRVRYRLNRGYGRVIIINHGYGYKTLYGHLSKILVNVGQRVDRWDVIGLSGDTGRATGPHLHYEVWHNGRPKNPEEFILN